MHDWQPSTLTCLFFLKDIEASQILWVTNKTLSLPEEQTRRLEGLVHPPIPLTRHSELDILAASARRSQLDRFLGYLPVK